MINSRITSLLFLLFLLTATPLFGDDIIPTNVWTNFGSLNSTINDELMPVGAIIDAYDPDGVHCGQQIAGEVAGKYRALPVYGDDSWTPLVDEGCVLNDTVTFKINGITADKLGPDSHFWVGSSVGIKIMDLAISQTFGLDISGPPSGFAQPAGTVVYQVTIKNIGNGIDWVDFDFVSAHGWAVTAPFDSQYIDPGDSVMFDVSVTVPGGAQEGDEDSLYLAASSRFSSTTVDSLTIVTTAGQGFAVAVSGPGSGEGAPADTITYPITIQNLGNGPDQVAVAVSSSSGWTIVDPPDPSYTLNAGENLPLDINLEIPATAPLQTKDTLTIIATSSGSRQLADTLIIVTTVNVIVSYGFTITGPTSGIGDPGDTIVYSPVVIHNVGDVTDRATLLWTSSLGWSVTAPDISSQDIAAGATLDVDFTVVIPAGATVGSKDTLTIIVSSQGDPAVKDTLTIITLVGKTYGIDISGPPAGNGLPGSNAVYTVTFDNLGNVADSFDISVTSSSGWQLTGLPNPVEYIDAYLGKSFDIVVAIPATAPAGHEDTLFITATSKSDLSKSDTLKIITTVDEDTGVDDGDLSLPGSFGLEQNYPNPFNPATIITFILPQSAEVSLEIFDILGRKVKALYTGYLTGGSHSLAWDGTDNNQVTVVSGIYFYRLTAGELNLTRKMVLLK
ncbi:MAG: T9SS type A sorting domain-containing protein [candidate division Zixibacteria bacterium]|nr:T9SS type A sorting domain-containing protein [candidate division Zixibacteria bacterium]